MKVGFLTASLSRKAGGVYDATRFLARGLSVQPACEIVAFGLADDATERDAAGWGEVRTVAAAVRGPRAFGYAPALAGEIDAWAPDVLHAHGLWMYPSVVSHAWSRRWRRPCVVSPHGMLDPWAVRNSQWKKRLAAALYENAHLRGAACIHALCEAEAQAIRAYGLTSPICVIPNGVELPMQALAGAPAWAAALPAGARVLLYLGRIHPKKGLRELVLGWHQALTQGGVPEEWHLVIAGWNQGGHEQELKALVDELRIAQRVHFVGPQFGDDKRLTYQMADAFVLPSFSEGLPMVVLEAWAHGLPVLMTPACNLPEGFAAGAALKIEPDAGSVAGGLKQLFALPQHECAEMGAQGRKLVESRFNWPTIAGQMLSVYRWVLAQGERPACVQTRLAERG